MSLDLFNSILTITVHSLAEGSLPKHPRSGSNSSRDIEGSFDLSNSSHERPSLTAFTNSRPAFVAQTSSSPQVDQFFSTKLRPLFDLILTRLDLTQAKAEGVHLRSMSMKELTDEKAKVKKELMSYDNNFKASVGRFPNEKEKEPIRICYIYYKNLKKAIDNFDKRDELQREDRIRELYQRLNLLKSRKIELNGMLRNYQVRFEHRNGRSIQYRADIDPIRDEYEQYKNLKTEIEKLNQEMAKLKG
jgi:ribosomal protein L29